MPRYLLKVIGILLILSFFIPIPTGMLRVAAGLSILVCTSLPFALLVQRGRKRFSWFNNLIIKIEDKLGEKITRGMRFTRPENDRFTRLRFGLVFSSPDSKASCTSVDRPSAVVANATSESSKAVDE